MVCGFVEDRVINVSVERAPVIEAFAAFHDPHVLGVGARVQGEGDLGEMALEVVVFGGRAARFGVGEVDAFDEFDKEVADGVVEGADFPAINFWGGNAERSEEGELGGFALVGSIDAIGVYFEDGF